MFYEQYDTEPVINIKDPAVVEPLTRAHAGGAREAGMSAVSGAFVLGATGFVGREVVRQLCVRGTPDDRPRPARTRPRSREWQHAFGELGAERRHDGLGRGRARRPAARARAPRSSTS